MGVSDDDVLHAQIRSAHQRLAQHLSSLLSPFFSSRSSRRLAVRDTCYCCPPHTRHNGLFPLSSFSALNRACSIARYTSAAKLSRLPSGSARTSCSSGTAPRVSNSRGRASCDADDGRGRSPSLPSSGAGREHRIYTASSSGFGVARIEPCATRSSRYADALYAGSGELVGA